MSKKVFITKEEPGFSAISVEGPSDRLPELYAALQTAGFDVDPAVGSNSILLLDVRAKDVEVLQTVSAEFGANVSKAYGQKTFLKREAAPVRKAFQLNLDAGNWYVAENLNDTFPFVLVREVNIERVGNNGDTSQMLTLEFHHPDKSMPIVEKVDSRTAANYALRLATEEDFYKADMIVPVEVNPVDIQPPSHGIPQDVPIDDASPVATQSNPPPTLHRQ